METVLTGTFFQKLFGIFNVQVLPLLFCIILSPVFSSLPAASADAACAQLDISFARGTSEPPGLGAVGTSFSTAIQSSLPGFTISTYAVDYPADFDFTKASDGGADLSAHLQDVAHRCPNTQFILGGYSQGAAVVDSVISLGIPVLGFTNPLPGDVANRIAGVALFGDPVHRIFHGPQPIFITPDMRSKLTDVCAEGDPICENTTGDPEEQERLFTQNHTAYVTRGLTTDAADFIVGLIHS